MDKQCVETREDDEGESRDASWKALAIIRMGDDDACHSVVAVEVALGYVI